MLLYFNVCCFLFVTHEKEAVIRPLYYVSFILQEILDFSSADWKKNKSVLPAGMSPAAMMSFFSMMTAAVFAMTMVIVMIALYIRVIDQVAC